MDYAQEIHRFRDILLNSEIGVRIFKIIWFGSTLKKGFSPESDVDILLFTDDGEAFLDRLADILLDFQMTSRCPIEIVTAGIDDLYPLIDYFLKNVISYGREVYSMEDESLRMSAAGHFVSLAQEFHESASDAIQRGHYRLGLDGAYNAAELAVKGFLILHISDLPGSHGGVAQRFGELYVKPGSVDRSIGRRFNRSLELRNAARYKFTSTISKADAASVLDLAGELIRILEERMKNKH